MNKKYALPAIAMFAVIMGLGAFAPAMADKPVDVLVCHFDIDGDVSLITVNANGAKAHTGFGAHAAHTNHDVGADFEVDGSFGQTEGDCPVHTHVI